VTNNGEATVINDRYEVHKRIGRGGMADVFSARDLLLDRQVAIKVLFPEFATDDNFVERFRREAQSAANLSHPNIVNVYDWGKYEGTYFIAMEEVQGRTLADVLKSNGQLTSKQAAEIASEVAAALGFAHEKGTAHRDIKPANILIGKNGQVKVADFGIARAMNAPTESNLTQVGSVMGTATYFSPEQAQGAQPDPRSDLYSLGIVMYEMVAGRAPFTGDNPVSIAYKQVHDAPQPLVQIVADVPKAYEAMVAKLLAKNPKVRYPSAGALRDDLRRFRNDEPVQALVAAANKARPAAASLNATTVQSALAPTGVLPVNPQATAVPSTGMYEAGYPTGASAEAAYYDSGGSRTGWYALAAFVALMALVVGGVLLFQALSSDDQQGEPSQFVLDDYFNRSLAVVTAELTDKGLTFVTVSEENALVPFGFVHRTNPGANEIVLENQEIQVFFNPDPQLQNVPQVVGIPLEEARVLLESQGFVIGDVTADETSESGEGTVLSSEPEAGVPVRQGTTVDMVVAAPRSSVQVPVVVGLTQDQAVRLLENPPYEFEVVVEDVSSETIAAGQVMSIAPTQGELVERGGTVTIQASSGAAPIVVPVVEGLTQGDATNQLRNAGFTVEVEFREVTPGSSNDGRVISQTPAAATTMDRGSTVKIVVGQALIAQTTLPPATTPPTTAAPVTDPPVTDPPATTAPATTAPATTAPATTVPVTVPPVTDALTGTAATSPP
jgi:beta-lactam-binding protein with PASTA domain/predicted Ser/Thr protein kinase